jgi:hypothetical protein
LNNYQLYIPQDMLRKISWTALRQMQAIRESVASTLKGGAVDLGRGESDKYFDDWLKTQGVDAFYYRHMPGETLHLSLDETIKHAISTHGVDMHRIMLASTYSRFNEPDVGSDRSSTGWDKLPNFITSSALIRVLGAMEQYELDVLKALLHYRPAGKQHRSDEVFAEADMSVVMELPDTDGRYAMPALWSWIRKSAENAVERRKIFKSVFGIDCFPSTFGQLKPNEIKMYYQEVYEQRNAIAHGRSFVEVTLGDYCKAEAFALSLFVHLSRVCNEQYSLGV